MLLLHQLPPLTLLLHQLLLMPLLHQLLLPTLPLLLLPTLPQPPPPMLAPHQVDPMLVLPQVAPMLVLPQVAPMLVPPQVDPHMLVPPQGDPHMLVLPQLLLLTVQPQLPPSLLHLLSLPTNNKLLPHLHLHHRHLPRQLPLQEVPTTKEAEKLADPTINPEAAPLITKLGLLEVLITMLVIIKPQLHPEEVKDTIVVDSSANPASTNSKLLLIRCFRKSLLLFL